METSEMLSACGLYCNECEFYFTKQCSGCYSVRGSTFWAQEMMSDKTCPLFGCAINVHGYKNCGDCNELPCATFLQMKDPDSTEEEHQIMLKIRCERLKKN